MSGPGGGFRLISEKFPPRFAPTFSSSCGIHREVNNLGLDRVETDLLYQLRISPDFPSALSLSLAAPVLSVQMVHINKADSHTSVSNLFISPQTEQTRRRSHPGCWPRPLGPLVRMKVVRGRAAVRPCTVSRAGRGVLGFFSHVRFLSVFGAFCNLFVNVSIRLDEKNIYSLLSKPFV